MLFPTITGSWIAHSHLIANQSLKDLLSMDITGRIEIDQKIDYGWPRFLRNKSNIGEFESDTENFLFIRLIKYRAEQKGNWRFSEAYLV